MGDRHLVPPHQAGAGGPWCLGHQVGHELVAPEVPVHPVVGAAPLGQAQDPTVEVAGGGQVVDGYGQVDGGSGGHRATSGGWGDPSSLTEPSS